MPYYPIFKFENWGKNKTRNKSPFTPYVEGTGYGVQGKADLVDTAKIIHDKHILERGTVRSFQYFFMGIILVDPSKSLV